MDLTELTPIKEEIKGVLGDKIDDDTLEAELKRYLNDYGVGIEQTKRGIIRKYGGADMTPAVTGSAVSKKIGELNGSEQSVDITAKVLYAEMREITVRGLPKQIISGILGDETATAQFTIWEPGSIMLDKGSVYNFRNCYSKKWNDKVQINLGNRGRVELAHGVDIEVVERVIQTNPTECKISELKEGQGNVSVTGRIVSMETRNVVARGRETTVYSGIIADDTGKVQFSAWNDYGLKEGETISVKGAYVRGWKGIPQLNLGDRCEVSRVDAVFDIVENGSSRKTVADIVKVGGGLDMTVEGLVVDIKAGSGLIKRCPQCNRSILNGICTAHGQVTGVNDLRLKIVIDDGTGAIGAIVKRADSEKLTGITMAMAEGLAMAQGEGVVIREMATRILMKRITATGNVMSDDYGPSMIVQSASHVETDVAAEANALLDELEAAL